MKGIIQQIVGTLEDKGIEVLNISIDPSENGEIFATLTIKTAAKESTEKPLPGLVIDSLR